MSDINTQDASVEIRDPKFPAFVGLGFRIIA